MLQPQEQEEEDVDEGLLLEAAEQGGFRWGDAFDKEEDVHTEKTEETKKDTGEEEEVEKDVQEEEVEVIGVVETEGKMNFNFTFQLTAPK